ncbi:HOIP UBA domain pair domain-containing protein [Phthorimaea operculella]|nr:HOIP UBA domain pair domain-containing protein [Phthorimaea operculella]
MSRREAERGLELARLMTDAERLGFSAAEVHAALAQNPVAPLAWLRERWPSLVAGVRAAAARLSPGASVTENEARAALARHRGAMWPAVTDCVDRHRRQVESMGVGEEGRLRGHVWGSPTGADDDAAPPPSARRSLRARADDSSDEYEAPIPTKHEDDDWMYLPLDPPQTYDVEPSVDVWNDRISNIEPPKETVDPRTEDIAHKLKSFLTQAGVPSIDENLLLKGLLADSTVFKSVTESNPGKNIRPQSMDLAPFESDFIDAYNALTRSSPLPSINNSVKVIQNATNNVPLNDVAEAHTNIKENSIQMADIQDNNPLNNSNIGVDVSDNSPAIQTKIEQQSAAPVQEKIINEEINATVLLNEQIEEIVEEATGNLSIESHTVAQVVLSNDKEQVAASQNTEIKLNKLEPTHPSEHSDTSSTNNERFEPTAPKNKSPQKIQKNKAPSKSETTLKVQRRKAPPRSERSTPEEERSSNLSDIVGNTQRLIQQMKEEINSDINSIDGHSMSQSEADYSSNESEYTSEQESSYSDTEETEDISSDENDESSTEENEDVASQRSGTVLNRTSSEENEQFEEAMDHIEEQNESFKQTNIEILDSIARSLQEDHTISLELKQSLEAVLEAGQLNANAQESSAFDNVITEPVQPVLSEVVTAPEPPRSPSPVTFVLKKPQAALPTVQVRPVQTTAQLTSSTLQVPKIVTPKLRKQDINNNMFVKVNSFDEIYDELSSPSNSPVEVDNNIKRITAKDPNKSIKLPSKKSPTKEVPPPTGAESSTVKTVVALLKQEITNLTMKPDSPIRPIITDELRQPLNAKIDTIEAPQTEEPLKENEISQTEVMNVNKAESNLSINLENTAENEESSENSGSEESSSEASRKTISPAKVVSQTTHKSVNPEPNNNNKIEINASVNDAANNKLPVATNSNSQTVKAKSKSPEKQTNLEAVKEKNKSPEKQTNHQTVKAKSKSPEKQTNILTVRQKSSSPEKQAANIASNKSQIPKPVKAAPAAKQKVDKNGPKVIASKVPVRRGSLKQYPAPAPPPKFGNVQNGHVKQLQTRLFNSKFGNSKFGKMIANSMAPSEPQPSTSTFNKKRPAPLPPSKSEAKPSAEEDTPTPVKERKHFFRETCRTEDEWTESDSDDAAVVIVRQDSSEPIRAPSPPPPITVRRVSGQLIDLATIRLLEGSPERQARMLLADGALESWEQAQLAVELVNRGTEPPAALLAALECADLDSALTYLHQDCELCASRLPEHEMVSMLRCTHRCCRECARLYFTVQITERSIADCVCPYCKEPELENLPEDEWLEYFAHLDILLKTLLEADLHELFQRKLRDRTLARDPNFRWCVECSSGFFVHPKHKKLRCPECKSVSCAKCRKPWTSNHEGLTCEQYATWLEDNDPERSAAAVQQHLRENGLECPRCRFKYSLSRGGCMHFTCTQCKYEFCYGCGKPFMMGARCGLSEYCNRLGLHAHHPRNCLFYLRDKEPRDLQTLLQMNNISFETKAPEGSTNRCRIQLQKETPTGLVDTACGSEVPPDHAGLCKPHYVEYLATLARATDPIPIMDVSELVAELRRRALPLPERGPWDTDPIYAGMCAEIVREKIPLE